MCTLCATTTSGASRRRIEPAFHRLRPSLRSDLRNRRSREIAPAETTHHPDRARPARRSYAAARVGTSSAASSASFRIPVALDAKGRLVVPSEATKRATYRCPECNGEIDLHAGEKKRRHFHHRVAHCSLESIVHLSAKKLIAQAVEDWLEGGEPVVFVRTCASEGCGATREQPIPSKVVRVALERGLPSGAVVDVALLARGIPLPIAAIEVVHSHAVDGAKAFEMGIPWIEVDAAQVCDAAGRRLVVVTDRFLPWLCADHERERGRAKKDDREARAKAAALAKMQGLVMADFPGYRIDEVARCSNGHEALVFAWEGKDPPWPRPPLVVAVQNETDVAFRAVDRKATRVAAFRRRYASACGVCGATLGIPGTSGS